MHKHVHRSDPAKICGPDLLSYRHCGDDPYLRRMRLSSFAPFNVIITSLPNQARAHVTDLILSWCTSLHLQLFWIHLHCDFVIGLENWRKGKDHKTASNDIRIRSNQNPTQYESRSSVASCPTTPSGVLITIAHPGKTLLGLAISDVQARQLFQQDRRTRSLRPGDDQHAKWRVLKVGRRWYCCRTGKCFFQGAIQLHLYLKSDWHGVDRSLQNSADTNPASEKEQAGRGNVVNPLEVSPASPEVSSVVEEKVSPTD